MLYLKKLLLIVSNVSFLFSAYVCFNNNKHCAFLVFVSICIISSLYHACKEGSFDRIDTYDGFCMLGYDIPFEYYYRLDFFTTQMTLPVVVWYILRPFKLFVLVKKKKNTKKISKYTHEEANITTFSFDNGYRLFGRSGRMKRIVKIPTSNETYREKKHKNKKTTCASAMKKSLEKMYTLLKRHLSCKRSKRKNILHEKTNLTNDDDEYDTYICEKKITKITTDDVSGDVRTTYRLDDSLTYECVSMPTVFKALYTVASERIGKRATVLDASNVSASHRKMFRDRSNFVTDSWYFETAYIVASAIVLWEFIDYFGPSVLYVTLPLLIVHSVFVLVVLFTDKSVHDKHKYELTKCNDEDCNDIDDYYTESYVFGYDTYNSLRLSVFGRTYTVSKHMDRDDTAEPTKDIIFIGNDRDQRKKGWCSTTCGRCCKVLAVNHSHVIVGCVFGILGLNLFEIQDHVDPNYYPVLHEFWHLFMSAAFYLLFFNGTTKS